MAIWFFCWSYGSGLITLYSDWAGGVTDWQSSSFLPKTSCLEKNRKPATFLPPASWHPNASVYLVCWWISVYSVNCVGAKPHLFKQQKPSWSHGTGLLFHMEGEGQRIRSLRSSSTTKFEEGWATWDHISKIKKWTGKLGLKVCTTTSGLKALYLI